MDQHLLIKLSTCLDLPQHNAPNIALEVLDQAIGSGVVASTNIHRHLTSPATCRQLIRVHNVAVGLVLDEVDPINTQLGIGVVERQLIQMPLIVKDIRRH